MRHAVKTRLKAWLFGLLCLGFCVAPLSLGGLLQARADDGGSQLREAERSVVRVLGVHYNEDGQVVAVVGGTGFVVAPGKIVTNNHVIAQPEGVTRSVYYVIPDRFAGTEGKEVQVQAAWPQADLAVLSAPDFSAPVLTVAATPPGKEAVIRAMGYPGVTDDLRGLAMKDRLRPSEPYVTSGSIALFSDTAPGGAREATIFHTAPIDHGNSGGPLLDQCSRLIGINTWSAAGAVSSDGEVESHPGQFVAIGASVLTQLLATIGIEARVENAPCSLSGGGPAVAQPVKLDTAGPAAKAHGGGHSHGGTIVLALIGVGLLIAAGLGVAHYLQRQNTAFAGVGGVSAPTVGPAAYLVLGVGVLAAIGLYVVLSSSKAPAQPAEKLAAAPVTAPPPGALVCAFVADQSLNPVAQASALNLNFDPALGCLNGHSAYARLDGRFIRLALNEKDHVASRLELSGDLKTFTRRDYALSDSDLAALSAARGALAPANCPVSADAVTSTEASGAAAQVREMLASNYFNGEPSRVMTWRCAPPGQAASPAQPQPAGTLDSH